MLTVRLTTRGRRTGDSRPVTLYAFPDGERLVVVASRGGAARDPAWALNLRTEPLATLRHGRETLRVRAREVEPGDERERIWRLVCDAFPMYERFQRRTARTIPLFVLEAVDAPASHAAS